MYRVGRDTNVRLTADVRASPSTRPAPAARSCCRVDRLRHQRIAGVVELPHRDVRGRARSCRQLHRRHAVDADERVARRQRVAPSRRRRRDVGHAERIVEGDRGVVVVEQRAGVAGPQQTAAARVLGAGVDVGQPVVDRRGHLDEAAVAEAAAVRDRALPVGVLHLCFDGQRRRRDVLEAAAPRCVACDSVVELDGVGSKTGAMARRRRLHLRLERDRRSSARPGSRSREERPRRAAHQHRNLIPQRPALELAGPDEHRRRSADRGGRRGRRRSRAPSRSSRGSAGACRGTGRRRDRDSARSVRRRRRPLSRGRRSRSARHSDPGRRSRWRCGLRAREHRNERERQRLQDV